MTGVIRLIASAIAGFALVAVFPAAADDIRGDSIAYGLNFNLNGLTDADIGRSGIPVREVDEMSMAETAGVRAGDRLTGLNGVPFTDSSDAVARLTAVRPGQTITLDIERRGRAQSLSVEAMDVRTYLYRYVLAKNDLTPDDITWGLNFDTSSVTNDTLGTRGIVISNAYEYGVAATSGVRPGDRLYGLDGRPFADGDDADARFASKRIGERVVFNVKRGGRTLAFEGRTYGAAGAADIFLARLNDAPAPQAQSGSETRARASGQRDNSGALVALGLTMFLFGLSSGAPAQGQNCTERYVGTDHMGTPIYRTECR